MLKRLFLGLILGAVLMLPVHGQKSTEVFIPIGESPGLSGKYSVIGKIESFDSTTHILIISGPEGEHRTRMTGETKIWLDSSMFGKTNGPGSHADCKRGRLCEIKYVYDGETRTEEAEWIKIRVDDATRP